MNRSELLEKAHMSGSTLAKLSRNQSVDSIVLGKICKTLNCRMSDIMELKEEKEVKDKHKKRP